MDTNTNLCEYVLGKLKNHQWLCEQISIRLPIEFKEDIRMRISHEAIYEYVYHQVHKQGHGALKMGCEDLRPCLIRRHKV